MDQPLRTMIDACRPGSEDLHEPEMAVLADFLPRDPEALASYDRSQRLDAALGAAFRDVPVPAGLEQRLLAAIGAASTATPTPLVAPAPASSALPSRRWGRRSLWASAAAASLLLLGLGYWLSSQPSEIDPQQLIAHVQERISEEDLAQDASWQAVGPQELQRFPGPTFTASPSHWRSLRTDWDRQALVFRIPIRQRWAYLVVMQPQASVPALGASPPRTPMPGATGGWKVGAWQTNGYVYVLLDRGDYRSLLRSRPTA